MSRRIGEKFRELGDKGQKAFIPFIMAGDPDLAATVRLILELEHAGSHVVEVGIPFSDPVADGPTIQRAAARALSHGYRLADYLKAVETVRRDSNVPLLLFSYYNPILQYGVRRMARDARSAGLDGLLITDMTPEEGEEYCACLNDYDLDPVFLVAPTSSPGRIARILRCSRGFVYVISRTGITGVQERLSDSILPTVERVRQQTQLPVAVGFGISRPEQVRAVWEISDGAVVGSAIVAEIEKLQNSPELLGRIGEFCRWLTGA